MAPVAQLVERSWVRWDESLVRVQPEALFWLLSFTGTASPVRIVGYSEPPWEISVASMVESEARFFVTHRWYGWSSRSRTRPMATEKPIYDPQGALHFSFGEKRLLEDRVRTHTLPIQRQPLVT